MSAYNSGLKPFTDHIVVELAHKESKTPGGLYIPETAGGDNKPMQGTIVAVGPGKEDVDMSAFTLGSKVLFRQYAGTEFDQKGEKYLVLRAGDVMCEVVE